MGPTKEGMIAPIQQERLLQMGEWLGLHGEAIYSTVPWTFQNDTATANVWYGVFQMHNAYSYYRQGTIFA